VGACNDQQDPSTANSNAGSELASTSGTKGINVALKGAATAEQRTQLAGYGTIKKELDDINALIMSGDASALKSIQALPFVAAANFDAERNIPPERTVTLSDFSGGFNGGTRVT
jgi:hypothetical protein